MAIVFFFFFFFYFFLFLFLFLFFCYVFQCNCVPFLTKVQISQQFAMQGILCKSNLVHNHKFYTLTTFSRLVIIYQLLLSCHAEGLMIHLDFKKKNSPAHIEMLYTFLTLK